MIRHTIYHPLRKNVVILVVAVGLFLNTSNGSPVKVGIEMHSDTTGVPVFAINHNTPAPLLKDARIQLKFSEERLILNDGVQPMMLSTKAGTLVVQAQLREKPFPSSRMTFHSKLGTVVSRDGGRSWKRIPLKPGDNGLNMEGDAVQLRDGTILALDTYVTPGNKPNEGLGLLYTSNDDWQTLNGPDEVTFNMPGVSFRGSSDDGGHPHEAARLHRTILELPNGDLLATIYGWWKGDTTSAPYQTTMKKTRSVLLRSTNRGKHWEQVSTIAVDPVVGTEGLGEPTLVRIGQGPNACRLFCFMRSGHELYDAI
ncbi:MAG: sialidase family protein [Chitinophagaceae bacterium]